MWIRPNETKDEHESVLEDLKYSSVYIDYLLYQDIKNINTKISKNKENVPVKNLHKHPQETTKVYEEEKKLTKENTFNELLENWMGKQVKGKKIFTLN